MLGFFGFIIYKDSQSPQDKSRQNVQAQPDAAGAKDPADTSEKTPDSMSPSSMPGAKAFKKPEMSIDSSKSYTAVLSTDKGDITVSLNAKEVPITVNNFVYLARQKFYNNTVFHRVIKGFMIQGGDPTGTGAGSPGYRFDDEPFSGEYDRGVIAMANAGPNTNGSQFFIMHAKLDLPPNYVIFGKVTEGLDVVDKIATQQVVRSDSGESSKPVTPAILKSIEIIEQ